MLWELSRKIIVFLIAIINAALRLEHVPNLWKIAKIMIILKPGKSGSCRPISGLFEKVIQNSIDCSPPQLSRFTEW